jgi:2-C-methyl-D-erythritol 4-phosphate cytidylyltransferase
MRKIALIVAGGKGKRMNTTTPKQFLLLKKLPILMHTLNQFSHFEEIILVLPSTQFDCWYSLCSTYNFTLKYTLVEGGGTRFHSVKNGLGKIDNNSIVAIHDGVRPLVSTSLINRLISQAKKGTGTISIVPVKDSIRKVSRGNSTHVDRENLYKVQTPQCFFSADIKNAYAQEFFEHFTDDASVFEGNGGVITTLLGEEKNIKITTAEDLRIAEFI